eukprot:4936028-Pleurochrysis_carterae.AAC.3
MGQSECELQREAENNYDQTASTSIDGTFLQTGQQEGNTFLLSSREARVDTDTEFFEGQSL